MYIRKIRKTKKIDSLKSLFSSFFDHLDSHTGTIQSYFQATVSMNHSVAFVLKFPKALDPELATLYSFSLAELLYSLGRILGTKIKLKKIYRAGQDY